MINTRDVSMIYCPHPPDTPDADAWITVELNRVWEHMNRVRMTAAIIASQRRRRHR